MRFQIVTVGRNVAPWLERALDSAACQEDQSFNVCVIDDASDDDSAALGRAYCEAKGWLHAANDTRQGGLFNQCLAIKMLDPDPEDVIVVLDADDELAHSGVLNRLAVEYADPNIKLTYGSYTPKPWVDTCPEVCAYPQQVINDHAIRRVAYTLGVRWNHLRTFRYDAFCRIDQDLRFRWPDGRWFDRCQDGAIMYPLLEMLGPNHRFIEDVLYLYNTENPESEWRIASGEIDTTYAYIINDLPPMEHWPS